MQNPQAPKMIDLEVIRKQADRQRADADTIAMLCDGVNGLLVENTELKARLAALEPKAEKPLAPIPGGL